MVNKDNRMYFLFFHDQNKQNNIFQYLERDYCLNNVLLTIIDIQFTNRGNLPRATRFNLGMDFKTTDLQKMIYDNMNNPFVVGELIKSKNTHARRCKIKRRASDRALRVMKLATPVAGCGNNDRMRFEID